LAFGASPQVRPAFAGGASEFTGGSSYGVARGEPAPRPRHRRQRRRGFGTRLLTFVRRPGFGGLLAIGLVTMTGLAGATFGGQYDSFVAEYGAARDVAARLVGFRIDAVTINGQRELRPDEILAAGKISPRNSLLFLDVESVRAGLMKVPLVKDASVRKLYPDQLVITLTEREPFAVWQRDGNVQIVASDGTAIDTLRDDRFIMLPFVVGEGANAHVSDYLRLLDVAGDLRSKIRAGLWIGDRRWNLKLVSGLEIKLPEIGAEAALRDFAKVARDNRILDKDLIAIDLRVPGRLVARLSEEAAATRAEALARKKGKGGA
jgi:cell division protein FtsQ